VHSRLRESQCRYTTAPPGQRWPLRARNLRIGGPCDLCLKFRQLLRSLDRRLAADVAQRLQELVHAHHRALAPGGAVEEAVADPVRGEQLGAVAYLLGSTDELFPLGQQSVFLAVEQDRGRRRRLEVQYR